MLDKLKEVFSYKHFEEGVNVLQLKDVIIQDPSAFVQGTVAKGSLIPKITFLKDRNVALFTTFRGGMTYDYDFDINNKLIFF